MGTNRLLFPLQRSAWCMLLGGLLASALLCCWVYRQEQHTQQAKFNGRAKFRLAALDNGLDEAIEALQVVNHFFVVNGGHVSREQFQFFTQPLLQRHPYIDRFVFSRLVSRHERPAFEAQMRLRFPGFTIDDVVDGKRKPAPVKERYRVIDYVEPNNERVFGLDASSRHFMDEAIARAEETGLPSLTGLFPLIREGSTQRGLRILMPVYQGGVMPADAAARRQAVVGYTFAILRAADVVQKILASAAGSTGNADLDIGVYVAASADENHLAYRSPHPGNEESKRWWPTELFDDRPHPFARTFDVAGSPMHLVVAARPAPFLPKHRNTLLTLLLSLLTTLAATAYLQSAAMRRKRILQLIDQRTEELKQVNVRLLQDNRARQIAEDALRQSRSELRRLAHHMDQIKEGERKRIARDIHDELGQHLMALRIDVALIGKGLTLPALATERIDAVLKHIANTIQAVRTIINDLRPGVLDLGLHAAMEWQTKEFERRTGIACTLYIDHEEFELDDARTTALFRSVQEALTNIIRHANATKVDIELWHKEEALELKIHDNGIGFAPECRRKSNSFGLIGIEERIHMLGGRVSIRSTDGQGTTMMFSVPL